jgi:hypothetical protein
MTEEERAWDDGLDRGALSPNELITKLTKYIDLFERETSRRPQTMTQLYDFLEMRGAEEIADWVLALAAATRNLEPENKTPTTRAGALMPKDG